MKKLIIILFIILIAANLYSDNGFTLNCSDSSGNGFRLFYFSENGNIIKVPAEYLTGLDSKGTRGFVSSDGDLCFYSTFDWAADQSYIYTVNISNGQKWLLIDDPNYQYYMLDLSPLNNKVIFSQYNESGYRLCIINTDGTGFTVLDTTTSGGYFSYGKWLDNNNLVYAKKIDDVNALYTINLQNGNPQYITDRIASFGDLSNDNKLLFYKYDNLDRFGYIDIETESITFLDGVIQNGKNHKWSPDSSKILYAGQQDDGIGRFNIYLYNLNNANTIRLTQTSAWHERCIGWFGSNVVYAESIPSDAYITNIYYMDIDSKSRTSFTAQENVKYDIGMACPLLSVYNGTVFSFLKEVIVCNTKQLNEALEQTVLPPSALVGNTLTIKIEEVLNEITYLNEVHISIGNNIYKPLNNIPELEAYDNEYIELRKDNSIILNFLISEEPDENIILNCTGYYFPFY